MPEQKEHIQSERGKENQRLYVESKARNFGRTDAFIKEQADRIASLEAEVKEKDEQIAIWVKCIENQNREIKELKAPFDSGVSAVGNMFELFKGEQRKNTDLQVEIKELQAEVERLKKENEALKRKFD
jgi:chromosome segregation ATPase